MMYDEDLKFAVTVFRSPGTKGMFRPGQDGTELVATVKGDTYPIFNSLLLKRDTRPARLEMPSFPTLELRKRGCV